jgi:hypothetical protein
MFRSAIDHLEAWKMKANRKPLVIRGARQVGKSYLVRMFAGKSFENLLEINLERDFDAPSLFTTMDPAAIMPLLEARYGRPVKPGKTLLFLDEIQAAPKLLACLRYFFEKLPELHVIAAGSLLDFALADPEYSMPVGRIEYLHLGPMSFEEFLRAQDRSALCEFLAAYVPKQEVPEAIHAELLRLLRRFFVVGGMPASAAAFVGPGGWRESEAERQAILSTYREDFAKYGRHADAVRIAKVFAGLPRLVGRKFVYRHIDREDRARELGRALELLCKARVAHRVRHTAANGVPLGAEADERNFKVLFMDVGLLCRSCGLSVLDVEHADPLTINSGAVAEQFVGQHLLYGGEPYDEPELFCWMREKKNASAELDYVLPLGGKVVPVEVKAGRTGTLRSLHVFVREKESGFALRFNSDRPSLLEVEIGSADCGSRSFRLLSLPLYLAGQARRLCRESMGKSEG